MPTGRANIVQILSMIKHYDKRPANALIAKAVEICAQKEVSHMIYYNYIYNDPKSSLTEFKRRNGFEKVLLPRYYVPTDSPRERIALRLGSPPEPCKAIFPSLCSASFSKFEASGTHAD